LLVDDGQHPHLRTCFGGLGWHVEACAEASAKLQLAGSDALRRGDLYLRHRGASGSYEILSRARRRRPHSAVLLFTGAAGEGVREEALRRGADEVITKPAPLARLRDAALSAMKKP
jgi:CheY-like chemotaxis protein